MKKQITSIALAGLALGVSLAYAGNDPGTGISGSKHDMNRLLVNQPTAGATADGQQRICAFCHTPHHKVDASMTDYNPLWSHTLNNSAFTAYGAKTVTFEGAGARMAADPLTGPSRLCMSCHDGVIAVDQHYNAAGTANNQHLKGDGWDEVGVGLANDVSNDHPIGFDISGYPAADAEVGSGGMPIFGSAIRSNLLAPNNTKLNNRPFTSIGFNSGGVGGATYFTCASCHEVHNKDNAGTYFLYEVQPGSKICLMCHDK